MMCITEPYYTNQLELRRVAAPTVIVHSLRENIPEQRDIMVTNHHSCFDDPGIWGALLSPSQLANTRYMRWGASASEVTNHSSELSHVT